MALKNIGQDVTNTFARALEAAIAVGEEEAKKREKARRAIPTGYGPETFKNAEARAAKEEKAKAQLDVARQAEAKKMEQAEKEARTAKHTTRVRRDLRRQKKQEKELRAREKERMQAPDPMEGEYEAQMAEEEGVREKKRMQAPDPMEGDYETLMAEELREEQAAELMEPKAEKFFDVLGLDEPPTDVLEDQEGFKQVMLGEDDEEAGEPESLAEMKSKQAAQPPKDVRVLPDREKMESFFKTATKSSFDPNSKRDRDYMAKIKSLLEKNPGYAELSPVKFAMKLYAAS